MCKFMFLQVVAFVLIIHSSLQAADPTCDWRDPTSGKHFNIESLHKAGGWKQRDSGDSQNNMFAIDYLFNFCGPHPQKCKDRTVGAFEALEVMGQITETCEALGDYKQSTFSQLDPSDPSRGIKLTYTGGDICQNSENSAENGSPRKVTFKVYCSGSDDDTWAQTPFGGSITKCNLEFSLKSSAGCPVSMFSFGGGLLKLIFYCIFGFAIYGIAGTIYNRKVNGLTGIEAFPHIDYWREFPSHALESIRSSIILFRKVFNRTMAQLGKDTGSSSSSSRSSRGGYMTV